MDSMEIYKYGQKVLRSRAAELEEIDPELSDFIDLMKETMVSGDGVGLAAPQVGVSKRIIVLYMNAGESGEVSEMINPEITFFSDEKEGVEEGCLSIPGVRGVVERPLEVEVRYSTVDGEEHMERFSGLTARIIQHEVDHLDGVLFVDRLSFAKRAMIKGTLRKLSKENG